MKTTWKWIPVLAMAAAAAYAQADFPGEAPDGETPEEDTAGKNTLRENEN